ncbi:sulfurtransferase [Gorillibacterium massiliense]|uniref:sulfurtransferase n=1 Tax=Gorillibacterium massiliense TaxID=1280390 RepID=UPI00059513C9|nr:sulfurtransferase [Gorillibacterium massiliense]
MSSIVSMEWVNDHRELPDVVVVDCRYILGSPDAGGIAYAEGHLPGAVYFDLERDLSAPVGEHGGRHPLPSPEELAWKLGRAGIGPETRVVAYDDQGGSYASRFWWLLRYYGHRHVVVMDQGFTAWREAGYPVTMEVPEPEAARFVPRLQPAWLAGIEEVRMKRNAPGAVLVDSRDPARYAGREETIDPIAGHIPGAVNRFWKEAIDGVGHWKPAEGQHRRFSGIPRDAEVIVYCGSGVTACPNVLSFMEAGYPHVKLYAGSWSDWISYEENPIAIGSEPREEMEEEGA